MLEIVLTSSESDKYSSAPKEISKFPLMYMTDYFCRSVYFRDSVLSVVHDMIFAVARAGYTVVASGQRGFDNTLLYQLGYIFSILTCTKFILGPRFCCLNMHAKE